MSNLEIQQFHERFQVLLLYLKLVIKVAKETHLH